EKPHPPLVDGRAGIWIPPAHEHERRIMHQPIRVLVAGAGIGGLTAALALQKRGYQVQVCEQATQLREVGAGLQLSPNALRALYQLGLEPALAALASEPEGKEIRLWNSGQTWKLFDLGASAVAD